MSSIANKIIDYYTHLSQPKNLPANVSLMNPYIQEEVIAIITRFYTKYFSDSSKRVYIVGINPGRFGGGVTGIPFTDPINLEEKCGIINSFDKKPELSSKFVYKLIDAFGGVKKFYSHFFITALYPLALIKDGKNYNYYDDKEIYQMLKLEILKSFSHQISLAARKDVVICLGKKNEIYLKELNNELNWFSRIITLDHPRYIMQYKYRTHEVYLQQYLGVLKSLLS